MSRPKSKSMSDFLVTFFVDNRAFSQLLSDVLKNKHQAVFNETLGLPSDFIIPFSQEENRGSVIYTIKANLCGDYDITLNGQPCSSCVIHIGTIYNLISDIKSGKSWRDFAKAGVDTYKFLSGAAKTYNNYKKIGNAVGAKTAMAWWAKSITGLKPLGRASTAKNPFARFANNLTNKTSPFNAQFKNVIDNFKGANGIGKAVSSWGAVAATGVLNWFSNKEEQANSNGTMSDGRVVAETITETVVDTALTYGAGIVVGAAITAVAGSVAVPGVVVVAASGAIIAGVNAGVQALTGKSTTEWISDGILDTGKAIGNKIDSAAKSVAGWFWKSPLRIT